MPNIRRIQKYVEIHQWQKWTKNLKIPECKCNSIFFAQANRADTRKYDTR